MTAVRRCLSLSFELDQSLVILAAARQESVSAMVETLLREHALVRKDIELGRLELALPDGPIAVPGRSSSLRSLVKAPSSKSSASGGESPNPARRRAGLIP